MTGQILGPAGVGTDDPAIVQPAKVYVTDDPAGLDGGGAWHLNLAHWVGFAAACRALLALARPLAGQPVNAPVWRRADRPGWMLVVKAIPNEEWPEVLFFLDVDVQAPGFFRIRGVGEETCPRRSLAMVLEAMKPSTDGT